MMMNKFMLRFYFGLLIFLIITQSPEMNPACNFVEARRLRIFKRYQAQAPVGFKQPKLTFSQKIAQAIERHQLTPAEIYAKEKENDERVLKNVEEATRRKMLKKIHQEFLVKQFEKMKRKLEKDRLLHHRRYMDRVRRRVV